MLIDSHCHLDFPDFADTLDDVVARARTAGVGRIVSICDARPITFAPILAIAERLSGCVLLGRDASASCP